MAMSVECWCGSGAFTSGFRIAKTGLEEHTQDMLFW